ncbi:SDR family oxidoreductase [Maritalea sp.]|jgi:NAD(P)-dependent dehydrogenase (short-subunit alcohol dehydrogenase family)|uniref:SDR family oxidoreductase n=1 Tax=Maritalea sp. TaxID=2003361 RepID=UPI0039E6FE8F
MSKGVALITGAADRIGAAIATALASDGYKTIIHYNSSGEKADALAAQISANGGTAATVCADLLQASARNQLIEQARNLFGPLNVLINNASIFQPDNINALSAELWQKHFTIHAETPVFLTSAFAKQLSEGATGNVINMIDQRVWALKPTFFSYTLSKSALWTATQTMAQSLAPRIRVNAIGPGPTIKNIHQNQAAFQKEIEALPLEVGPKLEEICNAVRFILSAPSMTGQMVALDGGEHLKWSHKGENISPQ